VNCPACGADQFGVYQISGGSYSRRCRDCWHGESFALWPLSRKVIYIDQFAISNMVKVLDVSHPRHGATAVDPFWLILFERLEHVVKLQLAVCPYSDVHRRESMVSTFPKTLKRMYEHLSHGISFLSPSRIALQQLSTTVTAWLDHTTPHYDMRPHTVTSGGLDEWHDRFLVTVDIDDPPELVAAVRDSRDDVHRQIEALFNEEFRTSPNRDFSYWFERERNGGRRAVIQAYEMSLRRAHEIATGALPFTYENLYQSDALDQLNLILSVFKRRGIPKEQRLAKVGEFLLSDAFKDYPASRITSIIWAVIAQAAASGQKEAPNAGTGSDIAVLALTPYCDAMFVDNGCWSLWHKIPRRYRPPCNVRLFSPNTRDEFMAYLQEVEDQADPAIISSAREVYGEPCPFVTMFGDRPTEGSL
jgi:hypothetical protein